MTFTKAFSDSSISLEILQNLLFTGTPLNNCLKSYMGKLRQQAWCHMMNATGNFDSGITMSEVNHCELYRK